MKMRKLVSLLSSLAIAAGMFASFATVSYAEETPANLEVVVGVDDYGYYYADLMFGLDNTTLGVAISKTDRGVNYYSGTGILGVAVNINSLPKAANGDDAIYATESHILASGKQESATSAANYGYTNAVASVEELAGSGEAVNLVRIGTNYAKADKTEAEVKEIFSNFGYVSVKVVTADNVKAGTNVSDKAVTYAISSPGNKHVDANYSININPTADDDDGNDDENTDEVAFKGFAGTKEDGTADGSVAVATSKSFTTKADAPTTINWTVTLKEVDGKVAVGTYTSTVDATGGTEFTLGMVINGLAAELVDTITAVLQ